MFNMGIRSIKRIGLVVLLTVYGFISPVSAENIVKFGHYGGYAPVTHGDGQEVRGILVDTLKAVFEKIDGYSPEFHGLPWARAQKMVENGELDAFCTVPTDTRKQYVLFGKDAAWAPTPVAFFSPNSPNADKIKSIKEKEDLRDINLVDYVGNGWSEANIGEFNPNKVTDLENAFDVVRLHRADVHISPYAMGTYQLNQLGMELDYIELPFFDADYKFKIGIRKDYPGAADLQDKLDEAIAELRAEGKLKEIEQAYLDSLK
jgi:polar amino acid transport system substrate-binding protein